MNEVIEHQLKVLQKDAQRGDGNVYHLYCQRFTSAVDAFVSDLPKEQRDHALTQAKAYGYGDSDIDDSSCCHGLDPQCCGLGCGDLDDGSYAVDDTHEDHDLSLFSATDLAIEVHAIECHIEVYRTVRELRGVSHPFALKHLDEIRDRSEMLSYDDPTLLVRFGSVNMTIEQAGAWAGNEMARVRSLLGERHV